jgi:glycosyltransferase involved in cell wall biosynthesis
MLFSVDAHAVGCHLTGNEVYISNLLQEYARLDKGGRFLAYISKAEARQSIPSRFRTAKVSENPFVRLGLQIPASLYRERPSLIHLQYTGPLTCPVPIVATIHDISFLKHPQYFTQFRAQQLKFTVKRTALRATRILTPSDFSAQEIVSTYGIPPERVTVVPNGVAPAFRPIDREAAAHWLRDHYSLHGPFILTVGDIQPRKNHVGLIRAFERVMKARPQLPHRLILVGKETWYSPEVRRLAAESEFRDRIDFIGWVPDEDLRYFYSGCDLMVFPSFYEGFGLPIIEAMACARAVACSNRSAMPEVADGAAILFDPSSVDEIARAIQDVLIHSELRLRMERLGMQRASRFTWSSSAQKTLDVYYEVAGSSPQAVPSQPGVAQVRS